MKEKSNAGEKCKKVGGLKKRDLEIGAWAAIRKFGV